MEQKKYVPTYFYRTKKDKIETDKLRLQAQLDEVKLSYYHYHTQLGDLSEQLATNQQGYSESLSHLDALYQDVYKSIIERPLRPPKSTKDGKTESQTDQGQITLSNAATTEHRNEIQSSTISTNSLTNDSNHQIDPSKYDHDQVKSCSQSLTDSKIDSETVLKKRLQCLCEEEESLKARIREKSCPATKDAEYELQDRLYQVSTECRSIRRQLASLKQHKWHQQFKTVETSRDTANQPSCTPAKQRKVLYCKPTFRSSPGPPDMISKLHSNKPTSLSQRCSEQIVISEAHFSQPNQSQRSQERSNQSDHLTKGKKTARKDRSDSVPHKYPVSMEYEPGYIASSTNCPNEMLYRELHGQALGYPTVYSGPSGPGPRYYGDEMDTDNYSKDYDGDDDLGVGVDDCSWPDQNHVSDGPGTGDRHFIFIKNY